jgi:WD40 repeat protein
VDGRADLFSLGCVLYRMATGRPAFDGRDLVALLMRVVLEHPPPPRQVNPALPPALADLIVKLLAKRPDERPPSAQVVADAFAAIEEARRPRPSRRRWLLLAAAALLAGAGLTVWLLPRERPEPLPPPEPGQVTFEFDEPDRRLILQRGEEPQQTIDVKTAPTVTLPPGDYTVRPAADAKGRRLVPDQIHVEAGGKRVVPLSLVGELRRHQLHSDPVEAVALSPVPGSLLALSGGLDRDVVVWDAGSDANPRPLVKHDAQIYCLAFSPDGKRAAWGGGLKHRRPDLSIRVWDLGKELELANLIGHESHVKAVAFSPDGRRLLSGAADGAVYLWDLKTRKPIHSLEGHDGRGVLGVAFSHDGKRVLSCGGDKVIRLWNPDSGKPDGQPLEGHRAAVTAATFSPDGTRLASASEDGSIRIWDLKTRTTAREIRAAEKAGVRSLAWSPDGRRLLSGSEDGGLRLWDSQTGEKLFEEIREGSRVTGVAFSADGRRALSGSTDRTVRLWELPK